MTSSDAGDGLDRLAGEAERGALQVEVIGRRVVVVPRSASTQDDAHALLAAFGPDRAHGIAITTHEQASGRGTRGRAWWSPPKCSLALSIVLAPEPPLERPAWLTLAAALAVVEAAARRGGRLLVKWPNDAVGEGGAKVAGVLAETVPAGGRAAHVVGLGVNVFAPPGPDTPESLRGGIGSVAEAGAAFADLGDFARLFLAAFDRRWRDLARGGRAHEELAAAFERASFLAGKRVRFRRGAEIHAGIFRGIGADLAVRLEDAAGRIRSLPGEQLERIEDAPRG